MAYGSINMVTNPNNGQSGTESPYLEKTDAEKQYLKKTGDTLEGNLDAGGHNVKGLSTPVDDGDAVPKKYFEECIETLKEDINSEVKDIIDENVSRDSVGIYVQETQPSEAEENDVWINTSDKKIKVYLHGAWTDVVSTTELEKSFISYITSQSLTIEEQRMALANINAVEKEEKVELSGDTLLTIENNKYYFITGISNLTLNCDENKTSECRGWITFETRGEVVLSGFDYVDDPDDILNASDNTRWEFNISNGCAIFKLRTVSE